MMNYWDVAVLCFDAKAKVRAIRNIEQALGYGIKRPSPSEAKNIPIARKLLVAAVAIQTGERFTETNLTAKRPGSGISLCVGIKYSVVRPCKISSQMK
jgi:sialic acid synthase SpsE